MSDRRTRALHIDDLDRIPLDIGMRRPVRPTARTSTRSDRADWPADAT